MLIVCNARTFLNLIKGADPVPIKGIWRVAKQILAPVGRGHHLIRIVHHQANPGVNVDIFTQ